MRFYLQGQQGWHTIQMVPLTGQAAKGGCDG